MKKPVGLQGPSDPRGRNTSRVEAVTQQSAAVAASAVVLQVHAPCAETSLAQVLHAAGTLVLQATSCRSPGHAQCAQVAAFVHDIGCWVHGRAVCSVSCCRTWFISLCSMSTRRALEPTTGSGSLRR